MKTELKKQTTESKLLGVIFEMQKVVDKRTESWEKDMIEAAERYTKKIDEVDRVDFFNKKSGYTLLKAVSEDFKNIIKNAEL